MEKDDYDPEADLQKIGKNPQRFQTSILLALLEHGCVIALTLLLFAVFSPYNIILGIVLFLFRIAEGSIQFASEPSYWRLIRIAKQYTAATAEKRSLLSNQTRTIFKTKDKRFKFAMICWSIGTLAFSIVLATYGVVPQIIGWLGIIASILVGFATTAKLVKPHFRDFTAIGGLSAILFEVVIGGWLLFSHLV